MKNIIITLEDYYSKETKRKIRVRKGASSYSNRVREALEIALQEASKMNLQGYINILEESTQETYLLSWAGFEVEKSTAREVSSFLLEREDAWFVSKKIKTTQEVIKSYLVDFK